MTARIFGQGREDNVTQGMAILGNKRRKVEGREESRVDDDEGSRMRWERLDDFGYKGEWRDEQKGVGRDLQPD